MIQKKVCMLGAFAVGKTSLVERYVKSIFSDKYHTTVGVKVDKKEVLVDEQTMSLVLWDLYGEDEFQKIRMSYLRGTSGYLLVADGTRGATLETALRLKRTVEEEVGTIPFVLVLNKNDLADAWEIDAGRIDALAAEPWTVMKTSAKTGANVEEAFLSLARMMLPPGYPGSE